MRPDDINPRTGLVVALMSIFLVFGFMFTVSGFKGETLGSIPLIAIGPAIFLPGAAAIAITRRTEGCSKWPYKRYSCCKKTKDKEDVELLKTPSEMESGKGSSNELDKKGESKEKGEDAESGKVVTIGDARTLGSGVEEDVVVKYLEQCYSKNTLPGGGGSHNICSVFDKTCSSDRVIYTATDEKVTFDPRDKDASVCPQKEGSPNKMYCCYVKPTELKWDQETVV
ncbi:transmembrane protein 215 [Spea bombifrons]|uniref:transmembrane protein 215 n=1 Tax=Spea bombifrons TaxID=233779 RepID=UPI00234B0C36|nr:transmembrane protein 215 [Spea bombifrons]